MVSGAKDEGFLRHSKETLSWRMLVCLQSKNTFMVTPYGWRFAPAVRTGPGSHQTRPYGLPENGWTNMARRAT
jgi:hypothetical protein